MRSPPASSTPVARARAVLLVATGLLAGAAANAAPGLPLAPQCREHDRFAVHLVAIDRGAPGHVVVAARTGDAGGCPWFQPAFPPSTATTRLVPSRTCGERAIAWTRSLGPRLDAALATVREPPIPVRDASWAQAVLAAMAPVLAAGAPHDTGDGPDWRYAGLQHLGAARLTEAGGIWQVAEPCTLARVGDHPSLVPARCQVDPARYCHGRKPTGATALEQACPSLGDPACQCYVTQACEQNADQSCRCATVDPATGECLGHVFRDVCRFPAPRSLEIDPRNGYVYAATDVGLLLSPDGGRHWQRFGAAVDHRTCAFDRATQAWTLQPAQATADPDAYGDTPWPGRTSRGARLLTQQSVPTPCRTDGDAFDLNAHPELLLEIGPMALAWQPCPGPARYATALDGTASQRPRGTVRASVAVRWRDPLAPGRELAGVFVAVAADRCQGAGAVEPGALTFWEAPGVVASDAQGDAR